MYVWVLGFEKRPLIPMPQLSLLHVLTTLKSVARFSVYVVAANRLMRGGKWKFIDEVGFRASCAAGKSPTTVIGVVTQAEIEDGAFAAVKKYVGTAKSFHKNIQRLDVQKCCYGDSRRPLPFNL